MCSYVHLRGLILLYLAAGCALVTSPVRAADSLLSAAPQSTGTVGSYEVIRLGRGQGNQLCLAATIGGKKGLMLVDTGANGTLLNESTYGFLLGKNAELASKLPKTASFNHSKGDVAVANDFTVGNANVGMVGVVLVSGRYLYQHAMVRSENADRSYDGLLGEDVLRHCNALVDCGRMALYLNTSPTKKVSMGAAFTRAGWTAVPMEDIGRDFAVKCSINGRHFRLIVDTGAPFTTVTHHLADSAHLDYRVVNSLRMGLVGTQAAEIGMSTVDGMQVGPYTVSRVNLVIDSERYAEFGGPNSEEGKDTTIVGLLGGDVLAANNAIVDVGGKTLYLRPAGSH